MEALLARFTPASSAAADEASQDEQTGPDWKQTFRSVLDDGRLVDELLSWHHEVVVHSRQQHHHRPVADEMRALHTTQRQQYRAFLADLHRRMNPDAFHQADGTLLVDTSADVSPVLDTKQQMPEKEKMDDKIVDPEWVVLCTDLSEMGFAMEQVEAALTLSKRNPDQAIGFLLEQPEKVQELIDRGFERPLLIQQKSTNDLRQSKSSSQGNLATPSSFVSTPASARSSRWSPLNFIEQKIQKSDAAKNNLKKIGGWLDKARAQFGEIIETARTISSPLSPTDATKFSESFTVSLGTQIKYTQNLRLMVTSMRALYQWPEAKEDASFDQKQIMAIQETALRAQSLSTLYSRSLTGIIVLVPLEQVAEYKTGQVMNTRMPSIKLAIRALDLFETCWANTELHFEDLETQLLEAEKDFIDPETGDLDVAEGSFFVSRHSNLPNIHVVFHLIIKTKSLFSDLNLRSPIFNGLRQILRVASRCDIHTLSVPLLFLPDRRNLILEMMSKLKTKTDSPKPTDISTALMSLPLDASFFNSPAYTAFLLKRSETVLKATKTFLLEMTRSYGRRGGVHSRVISEAESMRGGSTDGQETMTMQWVLPQWIIRKRGQEEECVLFEDVKKQIRHVYRTL